jgi:multiple sugar transport system permease protein
LLRKLIAFLILLIFIFPIYFLITSSFKSGAHIFAIPPKLLFFEIDFSAYKIVFGLSGFFGSSIIISFGSSSLTLIISIYSAYCLSRMKFNHKNLIILGVLSARMMPLMSIAIPIYFVYEKINLIDTYTGIILVHAFINLPLAVLLLKSFIDEIPKQIDESALIDGASRFKIIHKVIIPSIVGGLAVTFTLSFIFSWTEFICSLMIGQMNIKTISVQASILKTIPNWDIMAAFTTVSIVPVFILILLIKNHLVRGLTMGSIKE